jgi:hypothetical protein
MRVIAGEHSGTKGPASTFSPLNVWDLMLKAGSRVPLKLPPGHIAAVAILRGRVAVNGSAATPAVGLVLLGGDGEEICFEAAEDSVVLLMGGEPISEPIVGYGPFVMNSREEIETAISDFQSGKFGRIPAREVHQAEKA